MKVYLDQDELYRISYCSYTGGESLDSIDGKPIIVETIQEFYNKVKEQVRIDLLKELDYRALTKQRERPTDLYFCDALCEVFNELYDNEVIASNNDK